VFRSIFLPSFLLRFDAVAILYAMLACWVGVSFAFLAEAVEGEGFSMAQGLAGFVG
jgi:hypothetical protein